MDHHSRDSKKQQLPGQPPNQIETTNTTKNKPHNTTQGSQKQNHIHLYITTNQKNHKSLQTHKCKNCVQMQQQNITTHEAEHC
jgi:hypothetical protein